MKEKRGTGCFSPGLAPEDWRSHYGQDFGRPESLTGGDGSDGEATCPRCGEAAEWRDIEGHEDGGEYFCPLGCPTEGE